MMSQKEYVILVDENDREMGLMEKQQAHIKGLCHRAFSVFVFRKRDENFELLLQRRQLDKYHCAFLWTNTCCSHPRQGESVLEAAHRRLVEEMGFDVALKETGSFHYMAKFDNGLTENEVDHVLVGCYHDEPIDLNESEVFAFRWVALDALHQELALSPESFTPWFKKGLAVTDLTVCAF